MTTPLDLGWEDVEYGPAEEGGAVPDILYHGDGLQYFKEHVCPGPQAKLGSLLDP